MENQKNTESQTQEKSMENQKNTESQTLLEKFVENQKNTESQYFKTADVLDMNKHWNRKFGEVISASDLKRVMLTRSASQRSRLRKVASEIELERREKKLQAQVDFLHSGISYEIRQIQLKRIDRYNQKSRMALLGQREKVDNALTKFLMEEKERLTTKLRSKEEPLSTQKQQLQQRQVEEAEEKLEVPAVTDEPAETDFDLMEFLDFSELDKFVI